MFGYHLDVIILQLDWSLQYFLSLDLVLVRIFRVFVEKEISVTVYADSEDFDRLWWVYCFGWLVVYASLRAACAWNSLAQASWYRISRLSDCVFNLFETFTDWRVSIKARSIAIYFECNFTAFARWHRLPKNLVKSFQSWHDWIRLSSQRVYYQKEFRELYRGASLLASQQQRHDKLLTLV